MHRYLRPYYIVNYLLLACYPFIRYLLPYLNALQQEDTMGYSRENGVFMSSFVLIFIFWRKMASWDQLLA